LRGHEVAEAISILFERVRRRELSVFVYQDGYLGL